MAPRPHPATTPPGHVHHDGRLVVCGVDGSRGGEIAAAQAATLARGGMLTLVAVAYARGTGPNAVAQLNPAHAEQALVAAARIAREAGVDAITEIRRGAEAAEVLTARAADADLLVIGAPVSSRAAGILTGATATEVLHHASVPVLVARRPPSGHPFLERLLVATDGSEASGRAVTGAAAIAGEHGSRVALLHAGGSAGDVERRRMAEQAVALWEVTGTEPVRLDPTGDPVDAIVAAAGALETTLIVLGARGVTGLRALGSVSERVAHRAPCSVLVARG